MHQIYLFRGKTPPCLISLVRIFATVQQKKSELKKLCQMLGLQKHRVGWTLEGSNKSFKVDVFSNNQCSPTVPRSWCLRNLKQMRQIQKYAAVLICFDLYDLLAICFFWPVCCLHALLCSSNVILSAMSTLFLRFYHSAATQTVWFDHFVTWTSKICGF